MKYLELLFYSGDLDGMIPVSASRYAINSLKLPIEIPWRPWYIKDEVIHHFLFFFIF